jgi:hypothetical protein
MSAGYVCVTVTIGYRKLDSSHMPSLTIMHMHVHVGGCRLPVAEASRTSIMFDTSDPRMEGDMGV